MKKTTAAIILIGSFFALGLFATAHGSGYGSGYYERGSRYYGNNPYGYNGAYRGTYYNDSRYGYRGSSRYERGSRYGYRGAYGTPGAYGAPGAYGTPGAYGVPAPYYNNNRYEYRGDGY